MKFFTKKSVIQKIFIAIIIVMLFNFIAPRRVEADGAEVGGILLSPIFSLAAVILDNIQNLLEFAIIGGYQNIMVDKDVYPEPASSSNVTVNIENDVQSGLEFDGAIWNIGDYQIPLIRLTPEEIFANKVPALDVNFISPSVQDGGNNDRHTAEVLRGLISSWYTAIRLLAIVGLLSVLVYIGIRMLLTGIAADRAKYKRMLMDWVIAICLVFVLHYIMSFALTISESITAMIGGGDGGSIYVEIPDGESFSTNLMGFIRFMMQCTNIGVKIIYLLLYIMLIIFNVRFVWVYLKRVINMAFLTIIAPLVALTYPIDKVSDGSAQAFNMWIKEFSYNALIQPMHLLIYTILLGTSAQIAVKNPLYAIACLGFIMAAEKLVKQMFGFNKAGATVGSIAGAAGVTALASNGIMRLARGVARGGGNKDRVRTNDRYQRQGMDSGANRSFNSFNNDSVQGIPDSELLASANEDQSGEGGRRQNENGNQQGGDNGSQQNGGQQEGDVPPPDEHSQDRQEMRQLENEIDDYYEKNNGFPDWSDPEMQEKQRRYEELRQQEAQRRQEEASRQEAQRQQEAQRRQEEASRQEAQRQQEEASRQEAQRQQQRQETHGQPDTEGSPNPEMTEEALRELNRKENLNRLMQKDMNAETQRMGQISPERRKELDKFFNKKDKRDARIKKIGGYARGIGAGAGALAYKAARGTIKAVPRVAAAATLGAAALAVGATTGDGEKAVAAMATAATAGWVTGGGAFESSVGKFMKDTNIREEYGAVKYGSKTDYRNAKADKEFLQSAEFADYYEKFFKGKKSKKEVKEAFLSYRQAGITDNTTIRKALMLEDKYKAETPGIDEKQNRLNVQNIIQTKDVVNPIAFSGNIKAKETEIKRIEGSLTGISNEKQRHEVANRIFKGYEDFRALV